jgi:glutathione S-transferase
MATLLKLYHNPVCPYCHRVRIVLHEKGIPYEEMIVDLKNKPPILLQLNPRGRVPVIEHDGLVLYESLIIAEYLNDLFPDPPLLPADPREKARARLWMNIAEDEFASSFSILWRERNQPKNERSSDPSRLSQAIETLERVLETLERNLSEDGYLLGTFSLADIAFAPWMVNITGSGLYNKKLPERIIRWIERLRTRPSVRKVAGL